MTGVVLLLAGLALVAAGGGLGATLLRLDDPLDWLLATCVLAAAEIVVVSLSVGAVVHHYRPGPALGATAVLDAVLALAAWRRHGALAGPRAVTAAALGVARGLSPWQAVVCALAAAALLWRLLLAALMPPFAYDALVYHLTAVADWVQGGRVEPNPYVFCCSHYPSNAELLFAWPALLMHRDTLVDAVQVGVAVIGALAVAGLARSAGISRGGAAAAAALFLSTPIVLTQANTDYNDLTVAAFLLASLYFVTRLLETGGSRTGLLVAVAAATGFTLGTKLDGLMLSVVLAVCVAGLLAVAARRGTLSSGRALALGATFVSAVAVLGAWWYARNWIEEGSPVWPFHIDALGVRIFGGPLSIHDYITTPPGDPANPLIEIGRSWYHDLNFFRRGDYSYEERQGGLGPLWSWLGWAFALFLVVTTFRRRKTLFVGFLVPLAVVFTLQPYRWWSRFTIPLAAVGAIGLVLFTEQARSKPIRLVLRAGALVLVLCGIVLATWRLDPAGRGHKLTAPRVLGLAAHPSRSRSVGALFFDEYRWLDRIPRRATIVVEAEAPTIRFVYPLFGSHLDRTVITLPLASKHIAPLRPSGPEPAYLAVGSGSWYDRWAADRPGAYRRISAADGVTVYRGAR